ncbi:5-formyltetrahydrofolate cyclo-ligase [Palleronia sp. LCG004]|uniref:5-formyltetrahydrofolate cyclo-ligase n=1 Tax=Palleronia sp. LCG004 TaxID=3079304 RepID=UPI002941D6E7|nr:5-formyltetrahydrofolate cyclo-ligase [Palleronia sp. LCG004]WOI55798.1 5-formyltetrahydrofolate cyclo-ligase [Palleronia sp. LCG004]
MTDKAALRQAALAARDRAHATVPPDHAAHLLAALAPHLGRPLAGYSPIRTEIDPSPAMAHAAGAGPVALPVVTGRGMPLRFRRWHPDAVMTDGPFGARIPAEGDWIDPEILIVPLVAFDRRLNRLGYGGGFYDRTLEGLRAARPTIAIGFAHSAQELPEIPVEPTDQPLDLVVTEREIIAR